MLTASCGKIATDTAAPTEVVLFTSTASAVTTAGAPERPLDMQGRLFSDRSGSCILNLRISHADPTLVYDLVSGEGGLSSLENVPNPQGQLTISDQIAPAGEWESRWGSLTLVERARGDGGVTKMYPVKNYGIKNRCFLVTPTAK